MQSRLYSAAEYFELSYMNDDGKEMYVWIYLMPYSHSRDEIMDDRTLLNLQGDEEFERLCC